MSESITRNKSTAVQEHKSFAQKTYKVWIEIEQYDERTGCGNNCDAPGGELATFGTYEEAYDFAEQIDSAYSTYPNCHGQSGLARQDAAVTAEVRLDATTTLPQSIGDAIGAVVSYLWESERTDYEGCPQEDRDKHIFRHLENAARWLNLHTS
jgi:hypothetical protein